MCAFFSRLGGTTHCYVFRQAADVLLAKGYRDESARGKPGPGGCGGVLRNSSGDILALGIIDSNVAEGCNATRFEGKRLTIADIFFLFKLRTLLEFGLQKKMCAFFSRLGGTTHCYVFRQAADVLLAKGYRGLHLPMVVSNLT
ncbi:hypothetical protein GOBAR_AA12572 [Gossypium barbadense]|uniref:Uncharacterized protein n=1 Tax=Gossypium barbadense TaxID=3634 RepID=A0A2P5XXP9_GOSBA|nr:hypothetical protein GOBAR_AA12572 [Gossypium barbadense]